MKRLRATGCLLAVSFALACACFVFSFPASAESISPREIVLTLDDSGSMRQTDPDALSKQAALMFVDLMASDDRLSVVAFERSARVIQPLGELGDAGSKKSISQRIMGLSRSGGFTNIEAALESAAGQFSAGDKTKRAVLLLTDGKIDFDDNPSMETEEEKASRKKIVTELAQRLKQKAISIYAIAFGAQADSQLLQELAEATQGLHFTIEKANQIAGVYFKIFNQVKEPQLAPVRAGRFIIDASVDEATLVIETEEIPKDLMIESPSKVQMKRASNHPNVRWGGNDAFVMLTITKPEPGEWLIHGVLDTGSKILLLTNIQLEVPVGPVVFYQDQAIPVMARMDTKGKDEKLPFSVNLSAELLGPDGRPLQKLALVDDGPPEGGCKPGQVDRAADAVFTGAFSSKEPLPPGMYSVRVRAQAETFGREREYSLRIQQGSWISSPPVAGLAVQDGKNAEIALDLAPNLLDFPEGEKNEGFESVYDSKNPLHAVLKSATGQEISAQVTKQSPTRFLLQFGGITESGAQTLSIALQHRADLPYCIATQAYFPMNVDVTTEAESHEKPMGVVGWVLIASVAFLFILVCVMAFFLFRLFKAKVEVGNLQSELSLSTSTGELSMEEMEKLVAAHHAGEDKGPTPKGEVHTQEEEEHIDESQMEAMTVDLDEIERLIDQLQSTSLGSDDQVKSFATEEDTSALLGKSLEKQEETEPEEIDQQAIENLIQKASAEAAAKYAKLDKPKAEKSLAESQDELDALIQAATAKIAEDKGEEPKLNLDADSLMEETESETFDQAAIEALLAGIGEPAAASSNDAAEALATPEAENELSQAMAEDSGEMPNLDNLDAMIDAALSKVALDIHSGVISSVDHVMEAESLAAEEPEPEPEQKIDSDFLAEALAVQASVPEMDAPEPEPDPEEIIKQAAAPVSAPTKTAPVSTSAFSSVNEVDKLLSIMDRLAAKKR